MNKPMQKLQIAQGYIESAINNIPDTATQSELRQIIERLSAIQLKLLK